MRVHNCLSFITQMPSISLNIRKMKGERVRCIYSHEGSREKEVQFAHISALSKKVARLVWWMSCWFLRFTMDTPEPPELHPGRFHMGTKTAEQAVLNSCLFWSLDDVSLEMESLEVFPPSLMGLLLEYIGCFFFRWGFSLVYTMGIGNSTSFLNYPQFLCWLDFHDVDPGSRVR